MRTKTIHKILPKNLQHDKMNWRIEVQTKPFIQKFYQSKHIMERFLGKKGSNMLECIC